MAMALLFAASVVLWTRTAFTFGPRAALVTAVALPRIPATGSVPHAGERARRRGRVRGVGAGGRACVGRARRRTVRRPRRGDCGDRARPPRVRGARARRGAAARPPPALAHAARLHGGLRRRRNRGPAVDRPQRSPLRRLHPLPRGSVPPVLPRLHNRPHRPPRKRPRLAGARRRGEKGVAARGALPLVRDNAGRVLPTRWSARVRGRRRDHRPTLGMGLRLRAHACGRHRGGDGASNSATPRVWARPPSRSSGSRCSSHCRATAARRRATRRARATLRARRGPRASGPDRWRGDSPAHQGFFSTTPDGHIRERWTSPMDHPPASRPRRCSGDTTRWPRDAGVLLAEVPPYAGTSGSRSSSADRRSSSHRSCVDRRGTRRVACDDRTDRVSRSRSRRRQRSSSSFRRSRSTRSSSLWSRSRRPSSSSVRRVWSGRVTRRNAVRRADASPTPEDAPAAWGRELERPSHRREATLVRRP